MGTKDVRYRRVNQYGVSQAKLVCWLADTTKETLRSLAKADEMSMNEAVTRAVAEYVERRAAEQKAAAPEADR